MSILWWDGVWWANTKSSTRCGKLSHLCGITNNPSVYYAETEACLECGFSWISAYRIYVITGRSAFLFHCLDLHTEGWAQNLWCASLLWCMKVSRSSEVLKIGHKAIRLHVAVIWYKRSESYDNRSAHGVLFLSYDDRSWTIALRGIDYYRIYRIYIYSLILFFTFRSFYVKIMLRSLF